MGEEFGRMIAVLMLLRLLLDLFRRSRGFLKAVVARIIMVVVERLRGLFIRSSVVVSYVG